MNIRKNTREHIKTSQLFEIPVVSLSPFNSLHCGEKPIMATHVAKGSGNPAGVISVFETLNMNHNEVAIVRPQPMEVY